MSNVATATISHNKEMAREFLNALDPSATRFSFQIISDAGGGHTEIFHGSLDEFWPKVEALNNPQGQCGISLPPQRGQSQPVRRAISQVKAAVGIEVFVLRVLQATARGFEHAEIFVSCGRLGLQAIYFREVVECSFAHGRRSSLEPKMNIIGRAPSF